MFLLLCNQKNSAPFLRALLSLMHESPVDELDSAILINEPESSDWGRYVYKDANQRPPDEKMWYDLLSGHKEDVIHWWQQFGLNRECLLPDLHRLSRDGHGVLIDGTSPLLRIKADFPIFLSVCMQYLV